jgi:hypothetical protein
MDGRPVFFAGFVAHLILSHDRKGSLSIQVTRLLVLPPWFHPPVWTHFRTQFLTLDPLRGRAAPPKVLPHPLRDSACGAAARDDRSRLATEDLCLEPVVQMD